MVIENERRIELKDMTILHCVSVASGAMAIVPKLHGL